jgi:MoaA/NifB/PqqE/SkfB family radical SAM enzyme
VLHHLPEIRYAWLDGTVSTRPPVSVEIHLTNACNLRCAFCSYGRVRAGETLDTGALDRLLTTYARAPRH